MGSGGDARRPVGAGLEVAAALARVERGLVRRPCRLRRPGKHECSDRRARRDERPRAPVLTDTGQRICGNELGAVRADLEMIGSGRGGTLTELPAAFYRWRVELLEREEALAALAEARDAAARGAGPGRARLAASPGSARPRSSRGSSRDLDDGARVLLGTCDDLSIPRPLGPIRDLAGSVSPALEAGARRRRARRTRSRRCCRRARAAAAADGARARGRALGRRRDARRDHRARPADRLAAGAARAHLPRRRGAARPPRCTRRSARSAPTDALILELAPLSEGAVASLAGDARGRGVRGDRRQPVLRHRAARRREPSTELPPSVANAVLGRAARLDDASRRLVELVSVVPSRVRDVAARRGACRAGPPRRSSRSAGSCSRSTPRTCASATSWRATRSGRASRSRRGGACTPRSSRRCSPRDADPADIVHHAEAAGADDVVADVRARRRAPGGGAGVEPRGVLALPARRATSPTG